MAGSLVLPVQAIVSFTRKFNHRHTWRSRRTGDDARPPSVHQARSISSNAFLRWIPQRYPPISPPSRTTRAEGIATATWLVAQAPWTARIDDGGQMSLPT